MIRIERGEEPPQVTETRARRLPRACEAFDAYGPGSRELKDVLVDYAAGKDDLFRRQHRKCAYCERRTGLSDQPLEHIRPKAEAWRHLPGAPGKRIDHERYWWLTWTWENQLFACAHCNGRGKKANYLPLRRGANPLPTPPRPCRGNIPPSSLELGSEAILFLDPTKAGVDPTDHIQWRPVDQLLPQRQWRWTLRTPTEEGKCTARILRLCELTDDVNDHYDETVWPRFDHEVDAPRRAGDRAAALRGWTTLCTAVATAPAPLAGASWWQLRALRDRTSALCSLDLPEASRP